LIAALGGLHWNHVQGEEASPGRGLVEPGRLGLWQAGAHARRRLRLVRLQVGRSFMSCDDRRLGLGLGQQWPPLLLGAHTCCGGRAGGGPGSGPDRGEAASGPACCSDPPGWVPPARFGGGGGGAMCLPSRANGAVCGASPSASAPCFGSAFSSSAPPSVVVGGSFVGIRVLFIVVGVLFALGSGCMGTGTVDSGGPPPAITGDDVAAAAAAAAAATCCWCCARRSRACCCALA